MNNRLGIASRILVAFASGALIVVFFMPAWRIDLFAPQYPEGLTLNIWINGLSGDVDIINGLNHYIGMKPISEEMFPEFKYIPFVVGFFMLLGMIVAITGRRRYLFIYLALTAVGGLLAIYDFYRWGYDYGHHLDPTAPIQVPGFSYQPPILGHKRLLNFDAYSFPDVGGWVVIGAGSLAFTVWLIEWLHRKRPFGLKLPKIQLVLVPFLFILISCTTKPAPFKPGSDNCSFCKMGISDTRFGGELITKKGKIYKFDDLHCLIGYLKSGEEKNISRTLTVLFENPNEFSDVENVVFVVSAELKSPMGSNTAAFANKNAAESFTKGKQAEILGWQQLYTKVK